MKRPFALIGTSCFIAAVILCNTNVLTVRAVLIAALTAFLCSFCICVYKRRPTGLLFVSFAVLIISLSVHYTMQSYIHGADYNGKTMNISGTVTNADYYGRYEKLKIKINRVNGEKESFYLVAYSNGKTGLCVGDEISADASFSLLAEDTDGVKALFADSELLKTNKLLNVSVTGVNKYYRAVGRVSAYYKNSIRAYLPNNLSTVAIGMTIGDTEGMDTYLRNCFNYSGTAHLLVVSGLHLTIWMMFLSKLFPILRKKKMLDFAISGLFAFAYLVLTGFSVSVIRASVMLMIIKLSRAFGKGSDSVNSLGFAVTVLLTVNPYYIYSASFLLSVASTLGLILYYVKIYDYICKCKLCKIVSRLFVGRIILGSIALSIAVSIFTLPVFILKFNMFPIFSFVTNILVVDLASVLMLLTVMGVLFKTAGFLLIAENIFYAIGRFANVIIYITEKIGMKRFSTVAVSSRFFRYFMLAAVLLSVVFLILKRYKRVRKSILPVMLAALFLLTAVVSQTFELSHPSVDISVSGSCPIVLVRDGYDNILLGVNADNVGYTVGNMLGRHNLKTIGCIFTAETNDYTYSKITGVTNSYPADNIWFKGTKPVQGDFTDCRECVKNITLNNYVTVTPYSDKTVVISCAYTDILISCEKSSENLFEFDNKYDIIILNTQSFELFGEKAKEHLKNASSQVVELKENYITVYPDLGKIYCMEKF